MRYAWSSLLFFSIAALGVAGFGSWTDDFISKSSLREAPNGWDKLDMSPPPDHLITLQIGLKQHNFEGLVEELYRVSDPEHPSYGMHLSKRHVYLSGSICNTLNQSLLSSQRSRGVCETAPEDPFGRERLVLQTFSKSFLGITLTCRRLGYLHNPHFSCRGHVELQVSHFPASRSRSSCCTHTRLQCPS